LAQSFLRSIASATTKIFRRSADKRVKGAKRAFPRRICG
jgi:hypothetical protein